MEIEIERKLHKRIDALIQIKKNNNSFLNDGKVRVAFSRDILTEARRA